MKRLQPIESLFGASFPAPFKEFVDAFHGDRHVVFKVFNHGNFYLLDESSVAALNETDGLAATLDIQLRKIYRLIQTYPELQGLMPVAVGGLFHFCFSFLAFKKTESKDTTVYMGFVMTDGPLPYIKVTKIAPKFQDVFGDVEFAQAALHYQYEEKEIIIRSTDLLYSHCFDKYFFCTTYPEDIALQFNELLDAWDGVHFYSSEEGEKLYCECDGIASAVFDSTESGDEATERMMKNIKPLLAEKLGAFSLWRFGWTFYDGDIPSFGFGLTTNRQMGETLNRYGMLFDTDQGVSNVI
jgi:hypothetical protein